MAASPFIGWLLCLLAVSGTAVWAGPTKGGHEKLILILADGVRYDYLDPSDKGNTKGFAKMFKHGVRAEYVTPIYPANSYPNWYSIVTGLYGESHGFVQNYMYDEKWKDTFLMVPDKNASNEYWWNQAEPLWVTAEKNNVKTAMYWWDGCQVNISGTKPTSCKEYKRFWEWKDVNDDVADAWSDILDKFKKKGFQLAMVYYEAVDANGHRYGPLAEETKKAVKDLDDLLYKLQKKLEEKKMDDQVSIVVVSDHGMTDVRNVPKVSLDNVVNASDIEMILDRGSLTMIRPLPGKVDKVYNDIKNANVKGLKVYKKEEIPDQFHMKNNNRTQAILVVVDLGYFLEPYNDTSKRVPKSNNSFSGFHGYNPYAYDEMRAIMYARGPILKKRYVAKPIQMVDHYNLLCHLIGIDPLPNNGSWDRVKDMFASAANGVQPQGAWTLAMAVIAAIFASRKLVSF